jgi:hypothetical protein
MEPFEFVERDEIEEQFICILAHNTTHSLILRKAINFRVSIDWWIVLLAAHNPFTTRILKATRQIALT